MNNVFGLGCLAFVLFVFTAINSEASNPQELRLDSMTMDRNASPSDSGIIMTETKVVFHYNEYGLMDEFIELTDIGGSGNYIPYSRYVYTYDAYGHKASDTTYTSINDNIVLTQTGIKEYRYSPTGVLLMENSKTRMHELLNWSGDYYNEYQYDELGRLAHQLSYSLQDSTGWHIDTKKDLIYDQSNKLQHEIRYYWESTKNEWVGMDKKEHFYDAALKDTMELTFGYSTIEARWILGNRILNCWDAAGHLLQNIEEHWDESTSCWVGKDKYVYAYDDWGHRILEARYSMDGTTKAWIPEHREGWKYDQVGNLLSNTQYSGLQKDSTFWLEFITEYYYDLQQPAVNMDLLFTPVEGPCRNLLTGVGLRLNIPAMDTSMLLANFTFHYSPKEIQGVAMQKLLASDLYYEYSTKTLHIDPSLEATAVQVYDLQGRLLLNGEATERLPMGNIGRGLYLIRLVTKKGVRQGKVMVE